MVTLVEKKNLYNGEELCTSYILLICQMFLLERTLSQFFSLMFYETFAGSFLKKKSWKNDKKHWDSWEFFRKCFYFFESVFPFIFECSVILIRRIHLGCKLYISFVSSSSNFSTVFFQQKSILVWKEISELWKTCRLA